MQRRLLAVDHDKPLQCDLTF